MGVASVLGSGSLVMSNGLILSPNVFSAQVTSIDLHFEPSIGIITKRLDRLGMELKDFRTPLKRAIRQVVIPSIQTNFEVGGRPTWARLEDITIRKKKGNAAPLVRTGALQSAMADQGIWTVGRQSAFLAGLPSAVWYGRIHQAGYGGHDVQDEFGITGGHTSEPEVIGKRNFGAAGSIPPRPFVMIQPEDEDRIEQVFDLWLAEQIAKAGF